MTRHRGMIGITGAVVLALGACTPARVAVDAEPAPAPPPTPQQGAQTPAPRVSLRLVSQKPLGGAGYAQLGLTGANKPNGLEYRLRESVPPELPAYVPREQGGLRLFIADPAEGGWLAFYRGPLEGLPNGANVPFRAAFFTGEGERRWELELNPFLSRPDHLEIQDVRYGGGRLYFNEACQSYSREAGGRCSRLVRLDPARDTVDWRTGPLTSNNVFILHGPYVIAGYGFTAEPDYVHVIDRETGRVLARERVDSAPSYFEMVDGRLHVVTTNSVYVYELEEG